MSAQAFIEDPSVMYVISKVFLEQLQIALGSSFSSSALLCTIVFQCFEVACLFQETWENLCTQTQNSFCVLDIIYQLGNLCFSFCFNFC